MKSGKVLAIPLADAAGIYEQWMLNLIDNGIRLQKTTNSGDAVQFSALCLKGLSSAIQSVTEPVDTPANRQLVFPRFRRPSDRRPACVAAQRNGQHCRDSGRHRCGNRGRRCSPR